MGKHASPRHHGRRSALEVGTTRAGTPDGRQAGRSARGRVGASATAADSVATGAGPGRLRHLRRRSVLAGGLPLLLLGGGAGVWGYTGTAGAAEQHHDALPHISVPKTPYDMPAHPAVREPVADAGTATTAGSGGSDVLPVPVAPVAPGVTQPTGQVVQSLTVNGIPQAALRAYQRTQQIFAASDPGCHLPWQLVAAIGRVESNHGRFGGAVLTDTGRSVPAIRGPRLDGQGAFALVRDTDGGRLDGDTVYDRAVGAMQFLPSTWRVVAVDVDGDGVADPQDINDAAAATGRYLCAGSTDLGTESGIKAAVYRYNHSDSYVALVFSIARAYAEGQWNAVPDGTPAAGGPRFVSAGNGASSTPSGSATAAERRDSGSAQGRSTSGTSRPSATGTSGSRATTSGSAGGSSGHGTSGGDGGSTGSPSAPHSAAPVLPLPSPVTSILPTLPSTSASLPTTLPTQLPTTSLTSAVATVVPLPGLTSAVGSALPSGLG